MATQTTTAELVAQLSRTEGKAEIVGGEVVLMSPAGGVHGRASGSLYASLREYARLTKRGCAFGDNVGFLVDLPHRKSFCPDASLYVGPPPGPSFLKGAPLLAVEVRSPEDYGPAAEKALAAKREDYFAAGTRVVLDVEALREVWIQVYHANAPAKPATFRRGEIAHAEPEVPGWSFPVDDLLE
jgi:Uma2 family endonuclease